MIGTKDIEEILIGDLSEVFDVKYIYTTDDIPAVIVSRERIVIRPKEIRTETYFNKCFVEVNLCVPDLSGFPDNIRLQAVERTFLPLLDRVGRFDDTEYRYGVESHQILGDKDLECHYVNARLLFEILNTINK